MKKDPAVIRAERLRAILSMPEYLSTVGAWIDEEYQVALNGMTTAREPHEFHPAQGAYKALNSIKEQFTKVFAAEKVALAKLDKKRETI